MLQSFIDNADLQTIEEHLDSFEISGFSISPTSVLRSGFSNYGDFLNVILPKLKYKYLSVKILAEDKKEIIAQAIKLSKLSDYIFVEIPVITSDSLSNVYTIFTLSQMGVKVNASAIVEHSQIIDVQRALDNDIPSIITIYGDLLQEERLEVRSIIKFAVNRKPRYCKIAWGRVREIYNVIQAREANADIIFLSKEFFLEMKKLCCPPDVFLSKKAAQLFYSDTKDFEIGI